MKKIGIIGSGFSSMAAASVLAKAGHQVNVFEKNEGPGGRASIFSADGYTFDMGPSWYWMPEVFEEFYNKFDHTASDFYQLDKLDPAYKVFFKEEEPIEIPGNTEEIYDLFESIEKGAADKLRKFLAEAAYKYKTGLEDFVWRPGKSITEFIDVRVIKSLFKLQMLSSVSKQVRGLFTSSRLRQILEFPVLFLGATPQNTPALYTLMNHADLVGGTWYPQGGMHKISLAMESIAKEQGVQFHYNNAVQKFETNHSSIDKIILDNGQTNSTDFVINGSDYHHCDQELLDKKHANYTKQYWDKRDLAPSSLLFYVGLDTKVPNLRHHNLFFDADFDLHAEEIYHEPKWPSDPLFYVCCPSKTDKNVAPATGENLFILIPVAPDLKDQDVIHEEYFNRITKRIQKWTGVNIIDHIVYKRSFGVHDFKERYNAFKGNAYGLANTLMQTAFLKPKFYSKNLDNLYYTGQLTVPGPGMPPSIISGQLVAQQLLKNLP